jgi:hypothetical protein
MRSCRFDNSFKKASSSQVATKTPIDDVSVYEMMLPINEPSHRNVSTQQHTDLHTPYDDRTASVNSLDSPPKTT